VNRPLAGHPSAGALAAAGDFLAYGKLREARAAFEREFIIQKLRENNGNVSKTADDIDVERSNLHRKIKALGIETE
jgi:two-component system nitrogen regulation response regulator NtrX